MLLKIWFGFMFIAFGEFLTLKEDCASGVGDSFKVRRATHAIQLDVNSLCSQVFLTIGGSDFAAVG
jgi:hypothetical protein